MKRIFVLLILLSGIHAVCRAQGYFNTLSQMDRVSPPAQLFYLNPEQYNHHFEFTLPDDGRLLIDFLRLSDWGDRNRLQEIADIAARQVELLKDSFRSTYANKLVEMNIPVDGRVIAVNYSEDLSGKHQLAYKESMLYQLKSGFDTLRVVKNIGIRSKPLVDSGLIQVQYTFILKDINDITAIAGNKERLQRMGAAADTEIDKKRRSWSRQDADYHKLSLKYDPDAAQAVQVEDYGSFFPFVYKHIAIYLGVGINAYTGNTISPYFDESIAYLIPSRGKLQVFAGFNITAFGYLTSNQNKASYTSYNAEFGFAQKTPGLLQQRTSIVLGVMRPYRTDNNKLLFHMGFNFGFNSYLGGGFFFATDFRKNTQRSMVGVNFKFNL